MSLPPAQAPAIAPPLRIPRGVWALGFVSLLMDISSEMIHALLPVYFVTVLGLSTLDVGFIEGIAEATASITKIFSGVLSDRLGRRKMIAAAGYGLAALTKPIFPLASTLGWLIGARFLDRVGKGIRGAPRDALVADLTPESLRGAAFGLRQALDTIGGFTGPLVAIGLMWATGDDFRFVFWVAVLPAIASFLLIAIVVQDPPTSAGRHIVRAPLARTEMTRLPARYWWVVGFSAVFTMARFSEAFLILRAENLGVTLVFIPGVLVVMSAVYAMAAYPVGVLADRMDRTTLLSLGLGVLLAADLVLAAPAGVASVWIGVALWGLHMGLTQGLLAAMVADAAPAELRGTAFGVFNLVGGVMLLAASALAGAMWDGFGPGATFLTGAGFSVTTLAGLLLLRGRFAGPAPGRQ